MGADGIEKLPVTRVASKRHAAGTAAVGLGEQRGSEGKTEGEGHEKRSEAHRFAMLEESGSRGKSGGRRKTNPKVVKLLRHSHAVAIAMQYKSPIRITDWALAVLKQ
jgi:hypothetical protein